MWKNIRWILLGLGILIILAAGLFFLKNPAKNKSGSQSSRISNNEKPVFTHKMFELEKVKYIVPLGDLNGGYVEVQPLNSIMIQLDSALVKDSPIEVFAPTDMELYMYANTATADQPNGDWSLDFRVNDRVDLTIHHLNNASEKITSVVGNTPKKDDSRGINLQNPIKFKAGDLIGTTRGTSLGNNWNIYVYDKSTKNQFINQARYEKDYVGQRLITSTCPFDYYQDQAIKDSYYALLGASAPGQTTDCGKPTKDKKGTISGLWHLNKDGGVQENYEGDYPTPLSIYKRSDDNVIIYELGKKFYTIEKSKPSYTNPENITNSHCYNLADDWSSQIRQGYAFFRLDLETEMSVAFSSTGSCPTEFSQNNAKKYYR